MVQTTCSRVEYAGSNHHSLPSQSVAALADAKADTAKTRCATSYAVAPDAIHMAAGQLQHADLGCVSLGLHQHAQLNFFAWACSWLSQ